MRIIIIIELFIFLVELVNVVVDVYIENYL